jgi:hypothetical protein
MHLVGDAHTLEESVERLSRAIDEKVAERQHIIEVLSAFYRAPLSASSVQPVLTLAEQLNPALNAQRDDNLPF